MKGMPASEQTFTYVVFLLAESGPRNIASADQVRCTVTSSKLFASSVLDLAGILEVLEWLPQSIANISRAFAQLCVHNVPLLDAIASASLPKIPEFGTQSIANSAWSFATLFFLNVPLMEALSSEFIKKIGEMESQNLSNMAWAMATLVLPNKPLMEAISA